MTRLREWFVGLFFVTWPLTWGLVKAINSILPDEGRLRQTFSNVVFTRPWSKWYRLAYEPDYRDTFFECIVTFFYNYPIRKGDIVVQVGASFGEETIRFARSVGIKGRVFAIEPEARNVEKLRSIFPQRRWPQVTILQVAASDRTENARFLVGGGKEHRLSDISGEELTYEWWGVVDDLAESRYQHVTTVPADTIDNILRPYSLKQIDFILVETNGSELEVVSGINEIGRFTKRLGVRGHVMRNGMPSHVAIDKALRDRGFATTINSEGMVLAEKHGIKS